MMPRIFASKTFLVPNFCKKAFTKYPANIRAINIHFNDIKMFMIKIGFSSQRCQWIMECVRSATTSVLVHGSLTSEFKFERGLR